MANTYTTEVAVCPDGLEDGCIRMDIDDTGQEFALAGICTVGWQYTLSFWVRGPAAVVTTSGGAVEVGEAWQKRSVTFVAQSTDVCLLFGAAGTYRLWHMQLEQGSRASAYRPAPEDGEDATAAAQQAADNAATALTEYRKTVEETYAKTTALTQTQESILAQVSASYARTETLQQVSAAAQAAQASADRVRQTLEEKESSILATAEQIALTASASRTEKDEYETFVRRTEAALAVLSDAVTIKVAGQTSRLTETASGLESRLAAQEKHFRLDADGLTIAADEDAMSLNMDNDAIRFVRQGHVRGWWDGDDFYTGNVRIEVTERAQFGNFAFLPRTGGGLSLMKVEHKSGYYAVRRGTTAVLYGTYPTVTGTTLYIDGDTVLASVNGTTMYWTPSAGRLAAPEIEVTEE